MTELRELTIDETSVFITLSKANEKQSIELFNEILNEGGWVLKVISKRFGVLHKMEVDYKTMICVLCIGDGVAGICVKYVDDIAIICKEKNIIKLNFDDFSKKIYPWGVPCF